MNHTSPRLLDLLAAPYHVLRENYRHLSAELRLHPTVFADGITMTRIDPLYRNAETGEAFDVEYIVNIKPRSKK